MNKLNYILGKRPKVDCILCAVRDNHPDVKKLTVYSGKYNIITLNLYPYNPGHLMIFPKKHKEDIRELTNNEWLEIHKLQKKCINVLEKVNNPSGFNIGFNTGKYSGASINHLHMHIVPRYVNEIGIVELLSDSRIIVEHPKETLKKLKKYF